MKAHILLSAAICMQSIAYAVESVFLWPIPESVSSGQTKINLDVCVGFITRKREKRKRV